MEEEHGHGPDGELIGPQIPKPKMLYASGWYDGPTSGMVEVDGEEMWARMAQECFTESCGWFRRYQVMRLGPEVLEKELKAHQDPEKYPDYAEPEGVPVCWYQWGVE